MTTINPFKEIELIKNFAGGFLRHPAQVNNLLEADAEILTLNESSDEYLVLKADGIYEEIKENLYTDPYMIGWVGVTAPLSDIAAVGGEPTGILLSIVLNHLSNDSWIKELKRGINDACKAYHINVIGGDTNYGSDCSINSTAVGFIKKRKPILRIGMKPGDLLYTTSFLGLGNAYAYSQFFDSSLSINYQPTAKLKEGWFISEFASACMDTSDGLFPALAFLSDLNQTGFDLNIPLNSLLHKNAIRVQQKSNLPSWMFMAGPHGEYELLFSIPAEKNDSFKLKCDQTGWHPLYMGTVLSEIKLNFISEDLNISCNPSEIPNLFYSANKDIHTYFSLLQKQHQNWSIAKKNV